VLAESGARLNSAYHGSDRGGKAILRRNGKKT
jgi:hypothetical protein